MDKKLLRPFEKKNTPEHLNILTFNIQLQGDQVQLLFFIHFWQALKTQKLHNPNHFCQAYI